MNILYINHYAGGPRYGMEYRPHYLAREWVRARHNVTIVAASHAHVRSTQPVMDGKFTSEMVDGIRFVWCATPEYVGNGLKRVANMFAFCRRLQQWDQWLGTAPDVVIASSTYPLDIYPARQIAHAHGSRLIWEVHDLWPLSPIELGGISPRHPFMLLLQKAENDACLSADVVVSMLPKADAHLRAHGMAQDKFIYIPNGIDPAEWSGQAETKLPATHAGVISESRDKGQMLVAYAGAHGVANALGTVLDAAAQLRDLPVKFLLIGGGPEKAALAERVANENLTNVDVLAPVPKWAIPALLREMDVLYIGLQRQSLFRFGISPNKLMDYMMAGRPILCAIEAGNDPVGKAQCGFSVEPENAAALADAVRRMKDVGADARRLMGQRGQEYVQSEHLYPELATRFLSVMKQS